MSRMDGITDNKPNNSHGQFEEVKSVGDGAAKATTCVMADELHCFEVEDVEGCGTDCGDEPHSVEVCVLDAHLVHWIDRLFEEEGVAEREVVRHGQTRRQACHVVEGLVAGFVGRKLASLCLGEQKG